MGLFIRKLKTAWAKGVRREGRKERKDRREMGQMLVDRGGVFVPLLRRDCSVRQSHRKAKSWCQDALGSNVVPFSVWRTLILSACLHLVNATRLRRCTCVFLIDVFIDYRWKIWVKSLRIPGLVQDQGDSLHQGNERSRYPALVMLGRKGRRTGTFPARWIIVKWGCPAIKVKLE